MKLYANELKYVYIYLIIKYNTTIKLFMYIYDVCSRLTQIARRRIIRKMRLVKINLALQSTAPVQKFRRSLFFLIETNTENVCRMNDIMLQHIEQIHSNINT